MDLSFKKVHSAALAAAISVGSTGLAGCDVTTGPQPLPVPPTAQQRQDCYAEGQQIADASQGNINSGKPGFLREFGDRIADNKQQNSPVAHADNNKMAIIAKCLRDAEIGNTRDAQMREAAIAAANAREAAREAAHQSSRLPKGSGLAPNEQAVPDKRDVAPETSSGSSFTLPSLPPLPTSNDALRKRWENRADEAETPSNWVKRTQEKPTTGPSVGGGGAGGL